MELLMIALLILFCIYLSGRFSASEMAYSSCNEVRMENEAEEGNPKAARVLKILAEFDNALGAILIGNNLVNIAASSLASVFVVVLLGSDTFTFVATILLTVLVIIFGETIPKITAKQNANTFALKYSGFIYALMTVLKPLVFVVVWLVKLVTLPMKQAPEQPDDDESVEELHSIIDTAEDEGVLDADRTELVQAAIDFSDISAYEVMTARVDILALDAEETTEEILAKIEGSPYSRLPVYEGSIDHVIGTIHLNHLLKALSRNEEVDLRSLILPPCFVYKTAKLPKVLNTLKAAKQHLAIVTDEYSGTLGVISMEDVLEQIVGEIWDETDEVEPEVVERGDGSFAVDGDMMIDDFLELLSIDPSTFDYESETVGGWCIEYLERFPEAGDTFRYGDYIIAVTEADDRRVERVLVRKADDEDRG